MKIVNTVKENDCCICAYAMSENINWKISKRRLRKHLKSKKNLSVSTASVRDIGIPGYTSITKGGFNTINEMFNFGTGIIFLSWGDGKGHALFWDGCKFIDNVTNSRFDKQRNLNKLLVCLDSIHLVLIKNKRGILTKIKSFISMHLVILGVL